ncbi:MAG: DNA repair protein RecO [Clostridia bacterium]|nr:DNA repair protein RecO [Clostridia bacterium]
MTILTDGIIINEKPLKDKDKIITVLTREKGVIRIFANGAKTGKHSSATSLLAYSDFSVAGTRGDSYVLKDAVPKQVFFRLREDLTVLSLAQYFAELTYELCPREDKAENELSLILNALHLLCDGKKDISLIKSVTELRLLTLSGYMPAVECCSDCGCDFTEDELFFDYTTGEFLCSKCKGSRRLLPCSAGVLAAVRYICLAPANKIFSFSLSQDGLSVLSLLSEKYLKNITRKKFRTLDFYNKMI